MAEVQSFTLNLENKGLMIARPGDVLAPGFLTNTLNMTANKLGAIESRGGSSRVSGIMLPGPVHSQGRILVNGTAFTYQGSSTGLYRAFQLIDWEFSGNPMIMREGGPDLAILPHILVFDTNKRVKDNGTTVSNFGIAGPVQAASAVAAAVTSKLIDEFEYADNAAIQDAWTATSGTVTVSTTNPMVGSKCGNLAVNAATTGYIDFDTPQNLDMFAAAGDSDDDDYIVIWMRVSNAPYIDEIKILFDVDPTTNDFTRNFYWKAITQDVATLASTDEELAQEAFDRALEEIYKETTDPFFRDLLTQQLRAETLATGANQWKQLFIKKSEFTRTGTDANGWANVAKIRIQVTTNAGGSINLGFDDFKMQGGTDARLNGSDYKWIYRYRCESTGTHSPFSPVMDDAVEVLAGRSSVTVRNPRDTQVTHIELFRIGGDVAEYSFAVEVPVTSWLGTVTISDGVADSELGEVADETQVEMSNLIREYSQAPTSVRKTTDGGGSHTDYTEEVSDSENGTYANLNALGALSAGDWLVVGADEPFRNILLEFNANVNANTSVLTVEFWDGTTWRVVHNMTDGTIASGKTMAQNGRVIYDMPDNWERSTINAVTAYYVRLSVSAALSATVQLAEIRINANAFEPTSFEVHGGRVWCNDSRHTDRVPYSRRFAVEEFLEDNFIVVSAAAGPVVRPFALDEQLFIFTRRTIERVIGGNEDTFDAISTGNEVGLFADKAICKGRGRIFFRAYDGIYAMAGSGFAEKISLAIDPIFHGVAGGDEAELQPVDHAYAATEAMEFFGSKVRYAYRATNGNRYELEYDLDLDRWEMSDRSVTSYLRVDDEGKYYTGHSDGYVYDRNTGNQDQGSDITVRFRTQYLDFGAPSQDKSFTEIVVDCDLAGETLDFYADFDNGEGTPQTVSRTNSARSQLNFPLTTDTEGRNIAFRLDDTNGGSRIRFYKVTFFYIPLPTKLTKVITEWEDLGYAGDKRLRQLQLEINTNGGDVSVDIQVDGVSSEILTVNTTSRQLVALSMAADTVGKLVRLVMTGAATFSYYRHQWEFIRDPLQTTRFDTFELDFNYTRMKYIRRLFVSGNATGTVTLAVYVDEVLRHTAYFTMTPVSNSGWTRKLVKLPPGLKGYLFRFVFTSDTGFKIFLDQSDVEWHPLCGVRGYERARLARAT